jgi:hypothetical protein
MSPQDFIAKWGPGGPAFDLNERQSAQPHFIDLCQLLGVPLPGSTGDYIFEQDTLVLGEARGYANLPDEDILQRLLALNLARSATISPKIPTPAP